jgi:hypothetical protein
MSEELHVTTDNVPELTNNNDITIRKLRLRKHLFIIDQSFKKEPIFVFMIVLN